MKKKNDKKGWTVGRGIGVGLIAFSIALVVIFAFTFTDKQINIHKYEKCIEKQTDIDVCIPILNKNYYPQRIAKPMPVQVPVEIE